MSKHHFDITPHIVKQLGEQLVSDEITALLELIKNSYDADASYVSIEINTEGTYEQRKLVYPEHSGYIIVEDDGFGMSEQIILKSWLIISYSQKREFKELKKKTEKGRTPLGEKGLGRLSTQRLADLCEIFTNEKGKIGTHIAFNWKDFETKEKLGDVSVDVNDFEPKKASGTTLILGNINHKEVWEGKNLQKFKGLVTQIISPYKENRPFQVFIKINGSDIDLDKSNEDLRNLAISRFEFELKGTRVTLNGKTKLTKFIGNSSDAYHMLLEPDQGKKFYTYLSEKNPDIKLAKDRFFISFQKEYELEDIGGLEVLNGVRANPGSFYGKIDEFSYDNSMGNSEEVKEVFSKLSNYREFAQAQAGVKLFRDGFAIKPFGIDAEDWLKLGSEQTGGNSYYGMRPKNVIGFVNISEYENDELKDKTDREGLVSNAYSRNFFHIVLFIKDQINLYQETIRRSYNGFRQTYSSENNGIKTVNQAFNQLKETKIRTEDVKDEFKQAVVTVDKAIADSQRIVKLVKGNPLFSTDQEKATAEEVKMILEQLLTIHSTLKKLEKVVSRAEKLGEVIDVLQPKIQLLEEQLENFTELAGLGMVAELISHEFGAIAERLSERAHYYTGKLNKKELNEQDIYVLMEYINTTVNGLNTQLKHLDPALKYNRETRDSFSLSKYFESERGYYKTRFKKANIQLNINIVEDYKIKINRGKFTQIIDNIINNSDYWLRQRSSVDKDFIPVISVTIEHPWLYISDNGHGIPPAIQNNLFEPFVTTKPKGQGRGLGLFIIKQILDSEGCSIVLEPSKNMQGRFYIFAINLSNITIGL